MKNKILAMLMLMPSLAVAATPISSPSQITDGGDFDFGSIILNQQVNITARNATIRNLHVSGVRNGLQNENAAIRVYGSNLTLINPIADHNTGNGFGLIGCSTVTLVNPRTTDNGHNGIGSSKGVHIQVLGGYDARNNRGVSNPPWIGDSNAFQLNGLWYQNPGNEGGGGKWANTDDVTIDGLECDGNGGPGIWFDITNKAHTVRNVNSHNNISVKPGQNWMGIGIADEINYGPALYENNNLHDNQNASLALWETTNITARGNYFSSGVELRNMNGRQFKLSNLSLQNNNFYGSAGIYVSIKDAGDPTAAAYQTANKISLAPNKLSLPLPITWTASGPVATPVLPPPATAPTSAPTTSPADVIYNITGSLNITKGTFSGTIKQ